MRKVSKWTLLIPLVLLVGVGWVVAQVGASAERLDLPRVPWEGGPKYYAGYGAPAAAGWTDPAFFPIGVWFESVLEERDIRLDKEAGLNTYIELTGNSNMELVRKHGMHAITGKPLPGMGKETVGYLITDEADMFAGPGDGVWSGKFAGEGKPCIPDKPPCGYTAMRTLKDKLPKNDGRLHYANFGKGIAMWETDEQARKFVNSYTDAMSTDIYWYTDANICAEAEHFLGLPRDRCPRAANYGRTVDRSRELDAMDGRLQPVYAFIEVGWPGQNGRQAITPDQLGGAVMNALIHEARGIVYFNHSFGGPCISQHVLREPCNKDIRAAVTELNRRIASLAPVLNTQSFAHTFESRLDTMLKEHDGSYYVFATVGEEAAPGSYALRLPDALASATSAEVLFENRTVPIRDGAVSDTFERLDSYHIYKITP
ncbi:hypothetical protein AB0I81_58280 [Nonomuraea sp. NPDC050404]|uniref:hypothetical protein n=1 Tax=Nonomuraea sp. NPDC050404 TaxID=3155783 RepID=UPI0033E0ECD8